jgi:hypothetical protein
MSAGSGPPRARATRGRESAPVRSAAVGPRLAVRPVGLGPTPRHRCDGTRAPPRDGGRRLRYRRSDRRAGRWKVGPSRAARGDRTAGTGRVRGAAARGPSLLPSRGGCLSRCLKPVHTSAPSFNVEPFAAFAGSILHFVFRSFGPGVRYKGVGVYSRLMPAPRAHASACTMVRLRSHDICSRLVASCGLHRRARPRRGARAYIPREPRHASVVTSVVTSVARVLGALSASARLRLS